MGWIIFGFLPLITVYYSRVYFDRLVPVGAGLRIDLKRVQTPLPDERKHQGCPEVSA